LSLEIDKDSSLGWLESKLAAKGSVVPLQVGLRGVGNHLFGFCLGLGRSKTKQIGTAGVVHISLLGVKSYDQGKMN